jgi:hypothetical protein
MRVGGIRARAFLKDKGRRIRDKRREAASCIEEKTCSYSSIIRGTAVPLAYPESVEGPVPSFVEGPALSPIEGFKPFVFGRRERDGARQSDRPRISETLLARVFKRYPTSVKDKGKGIKDKKHGRGS